MCFLGRLGGGANKAENKNEEHDKKCDIQTLFTNAKATIKPLKSAGKKTV